MATRRKKLYFDISLTDAIPTRVYACTQFTATYAGDLYGSVLEDFAPLTPASSAELKRRNEVCAWFQPTDGQTLPNINAAGTALITARNQQVFVRFVIATATTTNTASWTVTQVSGLTFGSQLPGSTPIGTRHFGVMVARGIPLRPTGYDDTRSPTVRGRLYVQRQHTIEI